MEVPKESNVFSSLCIALALLSIGTVCNAFPINGRRSLEEQETVFDVMQYGAKADGKSDDAMKFIRAWNAACQSTGPTRLLIPQGNYLIGELDFQGPCTALKPVTIEIQGTLLASTDLSVYTRNMWITVEIVDGVIITGSGTLNGQGEASWKYAGQESGSLLPVSFVFEKATNSVIQNLKLVNSKGFHMKVTDSTNITVTNMDIKAPATSPNTDGLHISDSTDVTVTNSVIGTGDDCVSIGDGNSNVVVTNITCGPGHGISVGSLGKRTDETDVKGVHVSNCTLVGTTNGARIKTYRASPELQASNIVFEDIIMDTVKNPIVIDQHYNSKNKKEPSKVKISDVHFKNIRGSTISPIAVWLNCSAAIPCDGVELADINLTPTEGTAELTSACENVKPTFSGTLIPAAC